MRITFSFLILINTFLISFCDAQKVNFRCTDKYQKSEDSDDSIIIQTCYLNNFKFVTTSYPDYAGRYIYSEHEVFELNNHHYFKTNNSNAFNKNQDELVRIINKRIQDDFKKFSTDSNTKECLEDVDSIPVYKMDDFDISFNDNDIWFEVHWGLISACRSVDGTIISFRINEIKKFLK